MTGGGQYLGLKVDVDTYRGMQVGVPRLLDLFRERGLTATFFLSLGPDASGRAIVRLLRSPALVKKLVRTRAATSYGLRAALSGWLLPSRMIGRSFPDRVTRIVDEGHEVALHAWDHRRWQDELTRRPEAWIRDWLDRGAGAFRELTGSEPTAFGAPGWVIDDRALRILAEVGFAYVSCTRAAAPFVHEGTDLVEIPSDLASLEEDTAPGAAARVLSPLADGRDHVLPVHAEIEGGHWQGAFARLLDAAQDAGARPVSLAKIRERLDPAALPVRRHRMETLPGRAFACAV